MVVPSGRLRPRIRQRVRVAVRVLGPSPLVGRLVLVEVLVVSVVLSLEPSGVRPVTVMFVAGVLGDSGHCRGVMAVELVVIDPRLFEVTGVVEAPDGR